MKLGLLSVLVALLAFTGCSTAPVLSSAPALDALTQPEVDPTRQRAQRRLNLASAYYEQGQIDVAQTEARAALQIDPQLADAYSLLGLIHQRSNPALAEQSFAHALRLASVPPVRGDELAAIAHNYAWFLCQQKRFEAAQVQFQAALAQPAYRQRDKTLSAIALCQTQAAEHATSKQ